MATPSGSHLKKGYTYTEDTSRPEAGISSATKLSRRYGISNDSNSSNYDFNISKNSFDSNNQNNDTVFGQNRFGGKRRRKSKKGGKWSRKYKRSINCRRPKGFSQRQHCKYGRRSRRR